MSMSAHVKVGETTRPTPNQGATGNPPPDTYNVSLEEDLLNALQSIKTSGSFAGFGALSRPPPADLSVNEVGGITMPLTDSQAAQLIKKARQAPYGKGSDTIADTSVRNTWEIDGDQLTFRSPAWPGFLKALCAQVAQDLGIKIPINAEITEKIPGMFGTLIVCLPSVHQGGEVVLKHCGQKKVFKTSAATQSYAYWYSDVTHEVLPVTSGYRWVLTYNLAIDLKVARPSAELQRSTTQALRDTLRRWLAKEPRSRDKLPVQTLKDLSKELPVDIFLALLEKEEMGSCEYEIWRREDYRYDDSGGDDTDTSFHELNDVFGLDYRVKTLVDLKGRVVTERLPLKQKDILEPDCFDDIREEESDEGYMGNSGPTATHWYRVTAVVIVPRDSLLPFFNSGGLPNRLAPQSAKSQIRYAVRSCLDFSHMHASETTTNTLMAICRQIWNSPHNETHNISLDEDIICDILKTAINKGQFSFLKEAAAHHGGWLPKRFFAWARRWLRTGENDAVTRFNTIQRGLRIAISLFPFFADQFKALTSFVPIPNDDVAPDDAATPLYITDWACETLRSCLDSSTASTLGHEDGPAMVNLVQYYDNPITFLSQEVVPRLANKRDMAAFYLAFLARLREQSTAGLLLAESSMDLYRAEAKSFIFAMKFKRMCRKIEPPANATRMTFAHTKSPAVDPRTSVSHEPVASFFSDIIQASTETDDLTALFASKLRGNAFLLPSPDLHNIWVPFLRSVVPILVLNSIPLETPCCQDMYLAVLKEYVNRYVGREPSRAKDFARRGVNCTCSDCRSLNAFLGDAARTHETMRAGNPHTLVVTKMFKQIGSMCRDWELRRKKAREQFDLFDKNQLLSLLGADYAKVVDMADLSAEQPAQVSTSATRQRQPSEEADSAAQELPRPRVAGVKRKLFFPENEVVDLTDD
ncbi:2OG-Fe(II) oxygenase superfamily protein [Pochonia chlamydosporia 170]|uniref:2OG-Fe(II) oxygenase superfamily protein n=1 Tax=Pochonia chlamydosporia 170 TaxID=1380566 RepID=A0A179FCT7_METCM|nr:2OG-Fe(II) oxygenase superfamily protein [Pochonia chlamydosporia 170]OAQ63101.2 2OG-Fe(II) oxygenase superfamily protein [Pochonia chlamydosporia 170]